MKSIMTMYATMAMMGSTNSIDEKDYYEPKRDIEAEKAIAKTKWMIKQGIKPFFYGEHTIYARNKKNADRKAKNCGYL